MTKKKPPTNTLSLFGDEPVPHTEGPPRRGSQEPGAAGPVSAYVTMNRDRLFRWASKGVYFGSSSWKYPGWKGLVYNRAYSSKKVFDQECLQEYSGVFPTVCADFALYDFPDEEQMQFIHDATTNEFKVSLKVTDRITIRRYPNLPRHGANAGKENADFLNLSLFEDAFLKPIEALKHKRGAIIFEFSTFYPNMGIVFKNFIELLDRFLSRLPKGYEYAVELFQPYEKIKEENPELRLGLAEAVRRCIAEGKKLYAYVNNRAEGNSPRTIEAILDILDSYPVEKL